MRRFFLFVGLVILLGAGVAIWFASSSRVAATAANYSGTVEADQITIMPEAGGRVADVRVKEGDGLTAGEVLVQLDTALLDAQIQQAEAALATANANLAQLTVGTRPEDIAAGEGTLAQAMALRDGARKALEDARTARASPQALDTRIVQARSTLAQAQAQIGQAQSTARYAEVERDRYAEGTAEYKVGDGKYRATVAQQDAANAALTGAQKALDDLLEIKANPIALDTLVNTAKAQADQAEAQVNQAQAALDALKNGATPEQIAIARATVNQADAGLKLLQIQRSRLSLRAPSVGLVLKRSVNPGEAVTAGAPLLTIANLNTVKLTIYVPEAQLGRVTLGRRVRVQMDAFPEREFAGQVVFIAPQAEFTPKNVQTAQDRATTVFAVKVALDNPDRALAIGMTGEALIGN